MKLSTNPEPISAALLTILEPHSTMVPHMFEMAPPTVEARLEKNPPMLEVTFLNQPDKLENKLLKKSPMELQRLDIAVVTDSMTFPTLSLRLSKTQAFRLQHSLLLL